MHLDADGRLVEELELTEFGKRLAASSHTSIETHGHLVVGELATVVGRTNNHLVLGRFGLF